MEHLLIRPPQVPERSEGLYVILDYVKVAEGDPEEGVVPGQGPIRAPLSDSDARDVTEA